MPEYQSKHENDEPNVRRIAVVLLIGVVLLFVAFIFAGCGMLS